MKPHGYSGRKIKFLYNYDIYTHNMDRFEISLVGEKKFNCK